MGARVVVERERFPIVVMRVVGVPSAEQLEAGLVELQFVLSLNQRHALVLDLTRVGALPASLRLRGGAWLAEHRVAFAAYCVGIACVADTPVARAVFAAARWLNPGRNPWALFDAWAPAEAWAHARLQPPSSS